MDQSRLASRRRLLIMSFVVVAMVCIHGFWVNNFFVFGPPAAIAAYPFWPRISMGSPPFFFLTPLGSFVASLVFLVMILSETINWVILPWIMVWMGFRLRLDWRKLQWYERSWYVTTLLAAVPAIIMMWSPLGQTIISWVMD